MNLQKEIYEKYPVKNHKELSDDTIISIVGSIVLNKEDKIKILDIGCGGGQLLENFIKNSNIAIFGIDLSEKALKIAQKRGYKVFKRDVENESLPFENSFFDIVIINDLLEHLINPDPLLREIHRTIKTDGRFIINVPNISHPTSWFMQIFLDLPPMQSARYKSVHFRDYTLRMLKVVLKLNGFQVKQIKGTFIHPFNNFISRFMANLLPRLSERMIVSCEKSNIYYSDLPEVYFDTVLLLRADRKLTKRFF